MIKQIFLTGLTGFLTGYLGIIIGLISSSFMKSRGKRFKGSILGFLGGLTIGIVTFDLLPEAFGASSIYIAIAGILLGLILAFILDGKLENNTISVIGEGNRFIKGAIFMAIGIGIHNLPSGVALGSLISASPVSGFHLAIALIFHGIPEGLTLGMFLRECNASKFKLIIISILTSIPMGIGSSLGGILRAPIVISISLGFASAMILYVTLRETLPLAIDTWKGRITTVGNIIGMIIGMLIVYLFH